MKAITLLLAAFMSASVFAREVRSETKIVLGPYVVPVESSAFNPIGPDFKDQGEVVVYLTEQKIELQFPRMGWLSLKAVQDAKAPNYYYTPGELKNGPKVRIGFEHGDKLAWFFSQSNTWRVTIGDQARTDLVSVTPFKKMDDDQLIELAKAALEQTDAGGFEDGVVFRKGDTVAVKGNVYQIGEDDDESTQVGTAVITLDDSEGNRSIKVWASVKDL